MAEITLEPTLIDEVIKFVEEKWKHSECEICGTDRWTVFPEFAAYAYIPVNNESGPASVIPPPSVPFLQLSCANCGNLRLVLKKVFDEWRAEQRAKTVKSSS